MDGEILPDSARSWQQSFPAKLTAVTNSSGVFVYSWTEQAVDGTSGAYVDALPGRSGDATRDGAREINNLNFTPSNTFVMMRLRGQTGDHVYDFDGSGLAPTGFSGEVWYSGAFSSLTDAAVTHLGVDTLHGLRSYSGGAGKFVVDAAFADEGVSGTVSVSDQYLGSGIKRVRRHFVGSLGSDEVVRVSLTDFTTSAGGPPSIAAPSNPYYSLSGVRIEESTDAGYQNAECNVSAMAINFTQSRGGANTNTAGFAYDGSSVFWGVFSRFGHDGFGYGELLPYQDGNTNYTMLRVVGTASGGYDSCYGVKQGSTTYRGLSGFGGGGDQFIGGICVGLGGGSSLNVGNTAVGGANTNFGVLYSNGGILQNIAPTNTGQLLISGSIAWQSITGDASLASNGVVTLANTGVTAGVYGDNTHVAVISVDSKGRVTSASNVSISGATYTDADAQAAVGGILADTDTIDFTFNPGTPAVSAQVIFQMSVTKDSSGLKLVGDAASPANNSVYSTDSGGSKGWHAASSLARTAGTLAAAGSVQGTAAAITDDTTEVTGADGTKGVILPNRSAGLMVVYNADTLNSVKIYPPSGAAIGGLGTNNADGLTGGARMYVWVSSTKYLSLSPL